MLMPGGGKDGEDIAGGMTEVQASDPGEKIPGLQLCNARLGNGVAFKKWLEDPETMQLCW
jgi:hypothetical protein